MKKRLWLVEIRNKQGLTQEQVATGANIERAYYTQIELGVRRPSVSVAKRIASELEFDWTIFFDNQCSVNELYTA